MNAQESRWHLEAWQQQGDAATVREALDPLRALLRDVCVCGLERVISPAEDPKGTCLVLADKSSVLVWSVVGAGHVHIDHYPLRECTPSVALDVTHKTLESGATLEVRDWQFAWENRKAAVTIRLARQYPPNIDQDQETLAAETVTARRLAAVAGWAMP